MSFNATTKIFTVQGVSQKKDIISKRGTITNKYGILFGKEE